MTPREREMYEETARLVSAASTPRRVPRRRRALAALVAVTTLTVSAPAGAAPGDLDAGFGASGKVTLDFGGIDRATHVALMPDGRIVTIGVTSAGGSQDYAIARFGADGTPDATFGTGGKVTLGTGPGVDDIGGGIVVLADQRVVVAGTGNASVDFVAMRLGVNGGVDSSFAGSGSAVVDFGGTDAMNQMIILPDGRLVLVGGTSANAGDFAVARLNADGSADASFGPGGKRTVDFGGADEAVAVAAQADGKLVVVGRGGSGKNMAVARLNVDGTPDMGFGTAGKASVDLGGDEVANGVVVQADGRLVLAGSTSAVGGGDYALARLTASGAIDSTFDGDGFATAGFGAANETALALAQQQNGRLVAIGNAGTANDLIAARFAADGSVDGAFGSNGSVAISYGTGQFEYDGDIAIAADGKLVIVGSTDPFRGGTGDVAVARLQGDPVTGPPPPPPTPVGPTPQFTTGTSRKLPGATRLDAGGSLPGIGASRINEYVWTVTLPGRKAAVDYHCGENPVLSLISDRKGLAKVLLTAINNRGATATTTRRFVPVRRLGVRRTDAFACENPAASNQASTADCVKSFGNAFYEVNSRGAATDCFEVAASTSGSTKLFTATIPGPVALNGLYLPIPQGVRSIYDSSGRVSLDGLSRVGLRVGPIPTQPLPLNYQITPTHGKFHLVDVGPTFNAPKVLGGLKLEGSLSIDLFPHASSVKVGLGLPVPFRFATGARAQAKAFLRLDNSHGLRFDGLSAKLPAAWIGPIYVESLFFSYEKSSNSWTGTAKVSLPGSRIKLNAAPPPPDFGIKIVNGRFASAGFGVEFQPPTRPDLFPPFHAVLLKQIGASIGLDPLRLTGTIGISATDIVDEDGVLLGIFATPETPYTMPEDPGPQLAPLANRRFDRFALTIAGTAAVKVPILGGQVPLLNAYGLYEFPDYFEFGGGFSYELSPITLDGNVGGFVYPTKRAFNLEGGLKACVKKIRIKVGPFKYTLNPCASVGAVISSRGIGFCGLFPISTPIKDFAINIGAGYHWGDDLPSLKFITCDYTGYREVSPLASVASSNGGYASPAAAGFGTALPDGLPAAMFRVRGDGGTPEVVVTDPSGRDVSADPDVVIIDDAEPNTEIVAVPKPAAGTWTIAAAPGSPAIAGVSIANGLPAPAVTAKVAGRGTRRVLRYSFTPAAGRSVTFVERGRDTAHVLGTVTQATGQITFAPGGGGAGTRTIVAQVSQDGVSSREVAVASFTAPAPPRLAAPTRLRASRTRTGIRISWRRVPGATRYEVLTTLADGTRDYRVVRRTRIVVPVAAAQRAALVSVAALDVVGGRGPASTTRIAAAPPRRRS